MDKDINIKLRETESILNNIDLEWSNEYATWMRDKATIKYKDNIPNFKITSNYIYWCNLGINLGSEQNKTRPVLIVKTKINSPICTVLPLTSERLNDTRWYHIDLDNQNSTVLIEQLRNVSKQRIISPQRLKGKVCKISLEEWDKINNALKRYYCLTPIKQT